MNDKAQNQSVDMNNHDDIKLDKPPVDWSEGTIVINGQTLTVLFPEE